jgi:hypothetical protein
MSRGEVGEGPREACQGTRMERLAGVADKFRVLSLMVLVVLGCWTRRRIRTGSRLVLVFDGGAVLR